MCRLPNGIRTGPVTNAVVANSRDQPHQRAHGTKAGTVTTTHGRPARRAQNAWAGRVPSACEAAQPPKPLTKASSRRLTAYAPPSLRLPGAADAQRLGANGAAAQGLQLLNTEQNAIKCPILVQQQRVTASGCSLTLAAFDMANLLRGE